jgi:polyketide cyclase/dehydrase/lipid transport protein
VHSIVAFVPRDPQTCWRVFTDASTLTLWVPGLRRAQVLAKERGLPSEIHFELGASRVYTLVYSYDVDAREVRWQPKLGRRDGVSGFVRFDPADGGAQMTYGLEPGDARPPSEAELAAVKVIVDAFQQWIRDVR